MEMNGFKDVNILAISKWANKAKLHKDKVRGNVRKG